MVASQPDATGQLQATLFFSYSVSCRRVCYATQHMARKDNQNGFLAPDLTVLAIMISFRRTVGQEKDGPRLTVNLRVLSHSLHFPY